MLSSCDPCGSVECAPRIPDGQFRIVSATTGSDLVFGTNRIYDKEQIRFYSLKGADTTFFTYQAIKFSGTGYDSILYVYFYPLADVAYLRLGNGDIDTLSISYSNMSTKCCGTITSIMNLRYNNTVNIPDDQGTQVLMK